ncbi:MAG: hypothetical protein Q8S11_06470 [Daejeonella sp.]|uniref:hypothetical protein n=1 Tax=Daejeonella sp. TaxID=2805397 RepID=UPI0027368702|nr:hypothetical protein [Daejeonella sp.]MDP3467960.1 hypothetical protein [Daejeonella sp.]
MKFDKYSPIDTLKPYIKFLVVSENDLEKEYKVFPSSGLVIGFQYKGQLSSIKNSTLSKLAKAGVTGISDSFKVFKSSAALELYWFTLLSNSKTFKPINSILKRLILSIRAKELSGSVNSMINFLSARVP